MSKKRSKSELEERVRDLEQQLQEQRFFDIALIKGSVAVGAAMACGLLTLVLSLAALAWTGKRLVGDIALVATFAIMAAALVMYFAFVFRRKARIRAEISAAKTMLEMEAGDATDTT